VPRISTVSTYTSLLRRSPEKRNRTWKFSELKSLTSMLACSLIPGARLYCATPTQPPPPLTCTSSVEARSDDVLLTSKLRVISSRKLVSADRTAPIEPSSVVRALMRMQVPEQLPAETTRTLPFFSSPSSPISVQGAGQVSDPSDPCQLIEVNLSL
jgi:hypothetical protein